MKNATPPKAAKPKSIALKATVLNGIISFPLAQFGKLATANMGTGGKSTAIAGAGRRGRPSKTATA